MPDAMEIAWWAAAVLAAAAAGLLALRKGPRPGDWPVRNDAGPPTVLALVMLGAWILGGGFTVILSRDPELGLQGDEDAAFAFTQTGEFLARILACVVGVSLMRQLLPAEDPVRSRPGIRWKTLLWGAGVYLLALPIVVQIAPTPENPEDSPQEAIRALLEHDSLLPRLVLFVNVVIAAPIFEEMAFRGFLQGGLRRLFGAPVALVIAAAAFAALHPGIRLPVFFLGLVLGWLYERSRNLALPTIVHMLHNTVTFATLTLAQESS